SGVQNAQKSLASADERDISASPALISQRRRGRGRFCELCTPGGRGVGGKCPGGVPGGADATRVRSPCPDGVPGGADATRVRSPCPDGVPGGADATRVRSPCPDGVPGPRDAAEG